MENEPKSGWYELKTSYPLDKPESERLKTGTLVMVAISGENTEIFDPISNKKINLETDTFNREYNKVFVPARGRE